MKAKLSFICAAIVASILMASCASPLIDKPKDSADIGVLSLTLAGVAATSSATARTIVPGDSDLSSISSYGVTLSRSGYDDKKTTLTDLTGSITGLAAGLWNINVSGNAESGDIIASGASTVTIELPGPTAATVILAYIGASAGDPGSLSITLLFPKSVGITTGAFGVGASLDGVAISDLTVADNGDSNNKVVCTVSGITTATPLLRIALKKGSATMLYWAERVWVYKNITTTDTVTIAGTDFGAAPSAPLSLVATLQIDNSIMLKWENVDIADSYTLQRSEDAGANYTEVVGAEVVSAGTLQCIDSTTVHATSYIYRVLSRNVFGPSALYALASSVTTTDIPKAPSVVSTYGTQITLNWAPAANCTYEIWYSPTDSTVSPAPIQKTTAPISATKFTISGLANGTTYYMWLKEMNNTTRLTSGFGHVASGTTITPPAPIWGTAALLETDNAGKAEYPQIAFNTAGTGIAVWHQSNGTKKIVRGRFYSTSAGWGTPFLIQTLTDRDGSFPKAAMDSLGNAVIIWDQRSSNNSYSSIWSRIYTASTTSWADPVEIEPLTNSARRASLAMDGAGNAVAVWVLGTGATLSHVRSNRYRAATKTWDGPVYAESEPTIGVTLQEFAMNEAGNGMAVWAQAVGNGFMDIYACPYTAGAWGTPLRLDTTDLYVGNPQVATDSSGNSLVLWQAYNSSSIPNLFSVRYTATGNSWSAPALFASGFAGGAASAGFLAMNAAGDAMAIWKQNDGSCINAYARPFSVASGWGTPVMIEGNDAGDVTNYDMDVASDSSGNFVAVWYQGDGGNSVSCWSNYYSVSTALWGTAELIESGLPTWIDTPVVGFDSEGKAVALWTQYESTRTRTDIWMNKLK